MAIHRADAAVLEAAVIEDDVEKLQERWNSPRGNIGRVLSTCLSFMLLGANDSSYGLESYYHASYLKVSCLFISPVAGFVLSTLCNHILHAALGRRLVAPLAGLSLCAAYAVACTHPPFYGLALGFVLIGLGSGVKTASWNTFIGGLRRSNELLGFLHGAYGLGATILPLFVSSVLTPRDQGGAGWSWWQVYYVLLALAAADLASTTTAFWSHDRHRYVASCRHESRTTAGGIAAEGQEERPTNVNGMALTLRAFGNKVVLLCSAYLLSYVGSEVALGGWLVTFMMEERGGAAHASGLVASGFWAGITTGRVVLGFVTGRVFGSEKLAAIVYLCSAMALELMFWLIPSFVSSAVCASFLGFFLGPLFPCVIVTIGRLLPQSMQTIAVGICSAVGASGASIVPFMVGAIAEAKGVAVLQPIIFAFLVLCLLLWVIVSRVTPQK